MMFGRSVVALSIAAIASVCFGEISPVSFDEPSEPTFYAAAVFADWIPDGGAQLFLVFPKCPLGGPIDSSWTGLVAPRVVAQGGVDTVYFEDATSGLPIELLPVSSEMGLGLLRASGDGYFSVGAADNYGAMKPSVPLLFDIVPSGDVATEWRIDGPRLMNYNTPFAVHWALATDAAGRPVPSSFLGISSGVVRVKIVGESIPDSSARVANAFDRVPLREVSPMGFYGIFPFIVTDDETEVVRIIAESVAGTLTTSDTFEVSFLPDSEPANAFAFSTRLRIPQNEEAAFLGMTLKDDAPDLNNYSTRIRLSPVDISGTPSATIVPSGWQTMIGGAAGFTFMDSEIDTEWVFVVPETDSLPRLETPIRTPIQVVPPDWAISLAIEAPAVSFIGDSSKVVVAAVDLDGDIDIGFDGYFVLHVSGDDDSSATIVDSATGDSWTSAASEWMAIPMVGGRRALYLCDSNEDDIELSASDAEEIGLFDTGLLADSPEYLLSFESSASGGAVSYRFEELSDDAFAAGEPLSITVTARTGPGEIDETFDLTAAIGAGGAAITDPIDGIIAFDRGIATFEVMDDSTEEVDLIVSGPLFSDTTNIRFIRAGEGGILAYSQDYEWIPMGAERNLRMVIFGSHFIETWYNGGAAISIDDPNSNGSVDAPDSIYFTSGLGYITLSNSDAERFTIIVDGDPDVGSTSFSIESRALVTPTLPVVVEVGASVDSIVFDVTDTAFAAYPASGTLDVRIEEQFDNSTSTCDGEVIIVDGRGVMTMEDSEAESVWVYATIPDEQLFYMDAEQTGEWEYLVGGLEYVPCAVDEAAKPLDFAILRAFPNPFNPSLSVNIANPAVADIDLAVYDIRGKRVFDREYPNRPAGNCVFRIEGDGLPSGVYFIRVSRGDECRTVKAILLK